MSEFQIERICRANW